jgi:hypothetical protein
MNNAKNVGFKERLKFNLGVLLGIFILIILCGVYIDSFNKG